MSGGRFSGDGRSAVVSDQLFFCELVIRLSSADAVTECCRMPFSKREV